MHSSLIVQTDNNNGNTKLETNIDVVHSCFLTITALLHPVYCLSFFDGFIGADIPFAFDGRLLSNVIP